MKQRGRPKKKDKFNFSNLKPFSSSSNERINADEMQVTGPSESEHALNEMEQTEIDRTNERPTRVAAKRSRELMAIQLGEEMQEHAQNRQQTIRRSMEQLRNQETSEEAEQRRQTERLRRKESRSNETPEEADQRRQTNRQRMQWIRSNMSTEERKRYREEERDRISRLRQFRQQNAGRAYKSAMNITEAEYKSLSSFNVECQHCSALHFAEERTATNGDSFNDCCAHGKIRLDSEEIPDELKLLFLSKHQYSNEFFKKIRSYNSSLAFASFNPAKDDVPQDPNAQENVRRGPPCFRIHGQVYHRLNLAAHPDPGQLHDYGQLYIIDTAQAVEDRLNHPVNRGQRLLPDLVDLLDRMVREHNRFAHAYRMMREVEEDVAMEFNLNGQHPPEVKLLFEIKNDADRNRYNLPQTNEIAAVVVCNADGSFPEADIVVHQSNKQIIHLRSTDDKIEPMLYPLFFPKGTLGWKPGMPYVMQARGIRQELTLLQHIRYRIADRRGWTLFPNFNKFSPVPYGQKLTLQYMVDNWVREEQKRIDFIKREQTKILAHQYTAVDQYLQKVALEQNATINKKIILPSSFYGSSRFWAESYEDAMAIVRRFGKPDFFITMTCNPEWPEIKESLRINLGNNDSFQQLADFRPDIISRVFHIKAKQLIDDIAKNQIFGKVAAYCMSIEFQKRGLPHMHLLVILEKEDKIRNVQQVDDFISAEIPFVDEDADEDLQSKQMKLQELVKKFMIHSPCGDLNPEAYCMVGNPKRCRFKYPKNFQEVTIFDENEFPKYRRRNNGMKTFRRLADGSTVERDNRHVAPYNPFLLLKYGCHINVEFVGGVKSVKYIYKYIYKGHDAASISFHNDERAIIYDEAQRYQEMRYISPPEACWRINEFELQKKSHSVVRLHVHLEGQYRQIAADQPHEDLMDDIGKRSTLEAYFELNREDPNAHQYCYWQIPEKYIWNRNDASWKRAKQTRKRIGRIYTVSLDMNPELFHLRLLLLHVTGPTSYNDLKTVEGITYETYHQSCLARGLTFDDQQWRDALNESKVSKLPRVMRILFVMILIHGNPIDPRQLWEDFKEDLSEDFIRHAAQIEGSREEAIIKAYRCIAYMLDTISTEGRRFDYWINNYGMDPIDIIENENTEEILNANEELMKFQEMYTQLNLEQKLAVDAIIDRSLSNDENASCFYLDGPGGTGKTFVYRALTHYFRAQNKRVKNCASTGIAAILLPSGKTAHKTFGLTINLQATSKSNFLDYNRRPKKAGNNFIRPLLELNNTDAFQIDEAPMLPKYGFENADELLRKLTRKNTPFGGKIMIAGGDFRQCLPVRSRAIRSELVDLSIKRSFLWNNFKVFKFIQNQRVLPEEQVFAAYLLRIGDGIEPTNDFGEIDLDKLPGQINIMTRDGLAEEAFGTLIREGKFDEMVNRAILAPYNRDVNRLNKEIITLLPGETKIYTSYDYLSDEASTDGLQIPTEYLNTLNPADMPPHELKLKKNAIVILIRNLSVEEGLCNGTRLIVTELCNNIIKAKILTGDRKGEIVHIPRITLDSNKGLPFKMFRMQFPIRPAFALTINKSQGQTFEFVGIDLTNDVFSHGQLYVAFSRARRFSALRIHLDPAKQRNTTKNIVFKEILH